MRNLIAVNLIMKCYAVLTLEIQNHGYIIVNKLEILDYKLYFINSYIMLT